MPTKKPIKKQNWFRKYREDLWSASITLGMMVVMLIITLRILEILAPHFTSCASVMCQARHHRSTPHGLDLSWHRSPGNRNIGRSVGLGTQVRQARTTQTEGQAHGKGDYAVDTMNAGYSTRLGGYYIIVFKDEYGRLRQCWL